MAPEIDQFGRLWPVRAARRARRLVARGLADLAGPAGTPDGATGPIRLNLDSPTPATRYVDLLTVSGWAYSTAGPIVAVEARLDGVLLGTVRHGLARPDVRAVHPDVPTDNCGFHGVLTIGPGEIRRQTIAVRVTDAAGNSAAQTVALTRSLETEPVMEIERVRWRGGVLEVEGYALWPINRPPVVARVFVDGAPIGETRVHRSRPDIWARFRASSAAWRCGYRLRQVARPPFALPPTELHDLVVECVDAEGRRIQCTAHVAWEGDAATPLAADAWERVMAAYTSRTGREPAVLDWHTDWQLAALFPSRAIFSPPADARLSLPYVDASVDLVVVATADDAILAEARRVARDGVVLPASTGAPAVTPAGRAAPPALHIEWRSTRQAARPFPGATIIIPSYNAAALLDDCLRHLLATLHDGLSVEVLVVDDASTDATPELLRGWSERDPRVRSLRNAENLRFLRACNRAAAVATGDVLVFLNNDTLPRPGWLEPLLRVLQTRPEAGAVGGKLIYPDGRLQEAGGLVFADGSGWNFGRFSPDIDAPLFDFLREVHYCSGALLATWRRLFAEVGGFDERFAPMYYEDTDYCMSVRAAGKRVFYQPESVVVHLEGGSAGADVTRGLKAHQAANQAAFVEKWRAVLARYPAPPTQADDVTLHRLARLRP